MASNVFISFRYSDGRIYKERLVKLLGSCNETVDYSEDENRSGKSERTIRDYLYGKLKRTSVTIVLLTPQAVNHKRNIYGVIDDWMYDEIRYSLEDREGNCANGIIAVYTEEAKGMLIKILGENYTVNEVDNLFRANMFNVKSRYKKNSIPNVYDEDYDSYCSLISYETFISNIPKYVAIAREKREEIEKYDVVCRLT